jgi:hypothetical protein
VPEVPAPRLFVAIDFNYDSLAGDVEGSITG